MNSWLIISGGAKKALIKRIITYTTLRYIKKKCGDIISYSRSIQKIPGNCIIKNKKKYVLIIDKIKEYNFGKQ